VAGPRRGRNPFPVDFPFENGGLFYVNAQFRTIQTFYRWCGAHLGSNSRAFVLTTPCSLKSQSSVTVRKSGVAEVVGRVQHILVFPLDLVFLTVDAIRITWDMYYYRFRRRYREQPCIHCRGRDNGFVPRPPPPGLRKYCNPGLGAWLQPCIRKQCGHRGRLRWACGREGGYVVYAMWVPVLALALIGLWLGVIWLLFHLM